MSTIIYLVRHGKVENPKQVIYGRLPGYGLSEEGKRQAHALGKHLSKQAIHAIYTSPLERARETASIISSYHNNIAVIHDELLLEVNSPYLEGKPFTYADTVKWDFYQEKYYSLGQERKEDLLERMEKAIEKIRLKHTGKSVVVVSHGDPIMITVSKLLNKPFLSWGNDFMQDQIYVHPAKGFRLVFDASGAVEVAKLEL